jgi:NADH dehydrogenase FAD-containing subunit
MGGSNTKPNVSNSGDRK